MKTFRKGFTLIELLVVISIIALLSTLAVVSLNSTRAKSRDAKRITDIKQIQTALELYYAGSSNSYPGSTAATTLGSTAAVCLGENGFTSASATATCGATVYMGQVPSDPGTTAYVYTRPTATTYQLTFTLEGNTGTLTSGAHTANEAGIQ
jgi:prepilin-type N-terminal cleavage/methylation domain-containing protein